jgi:peptidoglycan/xylan/chitin deacetylase (PgdA/CDA1 family)
MESRLQRQVARRRRVRTARWLLAGLITCVLAAGAYIYISLRAHSSAAHPADGSTDTQLAYRAPKTSAVTTPATTETTSSAVDATPSSSQEASQGGSDAESGADAATRSQKAVREAAVRFPDAPEISGSTKSLSQLRPKHKYIALTLDDGYDFQPEMLKFLKDHNVRCTTFLVGNWASGHTKDVKAMRDAGFEIANHSWSHPFLTRLSSSGVRRELIRTQRVITGVTGDQAPYLRPPFGDTDSGVKSAAAGLGYRIVLWNRSFGDSGRGPTPKKLYNNVMKSRGGVKPGDIILGHWSSKPTYEALKKIVPELQAQGYEFVTVSELIADSKK